MTKEELKENEMKKNYLNSYKKIVKKIKSLEEQLAALVEVKRTANVQKLTDMPQGNKQTDLSDYIVLIETKEEEISKQRLECENARIDILKTINELCNVTEIIVLIKRYILLRSWDEISEEMGYSYRHVLRIHGDALKNLNLSHDVIAMSC